MHSRNPWGDDVVSSFIDLVAHSQVVVVEANMGHHTGKLRTDVEDDSVCARLSRVAID
jgi:hypothetical protein